MMHLLLIILVIVIRQHTDVEFELCSNPQYFAILLFAIIGGDTKACKETTVSDSIWEVECTVWGVTMICGDVHWLIGRDRLVLASDGEKNGYKASCFKV